MPVLTALAEVALLLAMAAGIGFVGRLARQFLIVSIIAVGLIAAASHSGGDSKTLFGAGVDLVLKPFQDAAGRTVELLSGAVTEDRTDFPKIVAEGRATG